METPGAVKPKEANKKNQKFFKVINFLILIILLYY